MRQTGDLLQITKYGVAANAAAHRFLQVSELLKAGAAPSIAPQRRPAHRFSVRIIFLTWVAMGIRTPDLLHAMNHSQVTRLAHMSAEQARHWLRLAATSSRKPSPAAICPS